jgi:hypothetical protein
MTSPPEFSALHPLDSFISGYCALQGMAGGSSVTPASGNRATAFVDNSVATVDAKLMPSLIGERSKY